MGVWEEAEPLMAPTVVHPGVSRFDGAPWPEYVHGRPALVVPQVPGLARPVLPGDGWSDEIPAEPHPGWELVLDGQHVTITRPDGTEWFEGLLFLTRLWSRAVRTRGNVVLIAGAFAHLGEFHAAGEAGALRLVVVRVRLAGGAS
ncbi:hypothetical protein [Streptomyces antimycoticus]|uniref:hypothetical protein n=1 Tax=Streptomyces antimycoticus TaxID=68175 RepID=UPI0036E77C4A